MRTRMKDVATWTMLISPAASPRPIRTTKQELSNYLSATHSVCMRYQTVILLLASTAAPALAQGRWKEIGKTSAGNAIYLDPSTVKTVNGITTARIRVRFVPPIATPEGNWVTSQHLAMFNCAKATFASKESIYFSDEAGKKVVEKKVNKIPGYSQATPGSITKVALDYLCKKP
jgi:surface-adhesin protein E